jgi:hypothetical protein
VPLGDWLPEFDVRERHERFVAAPPERALQLALAAPATPDWIVRTLFRLRRVPHGSTIEELAAEIGLEERQRTKRIVAANTQSVPLDPYHASP